ncbi:MAG: transglycosylase SLT domain-containing protein [Chloroflexi bacterium]|nr:transglycosylase SLT domain-containing protein [Chloroflexota bacterium]
MLQRALAALVLVAVVGGCTSPSPAAPPTSAPSTASQPAAAPPASPVPQAAPAPTAAPAPRPAPSPTADPLAGLAPQARAEFERGERLLLAADYAGAIDLFERLAGAQSGAARLEARLRLGEALGRAGQGTRATETLEALRREQPQSPQAEWATYFLAEIQAANGQLDASATQLSALARNHPELAPALRLKQAEWALQAKRSDLAARAADAGLKDAQPRLLRIELLETLGKARTAEGDPEGAYQAYRQILALAGTTSYLGEQLYNLAVAYREIGKQDEALRALQTVVRDFPRSKWAPAALDLLDKLGKLSSVDGYHIGRVRYVWGNYRGAITAFDQYLAQQPNGPDAESARLYRAQSMMAPGKEGPAIDLLKKLATQAEDEEIAAQALLEAGKGYESMGSFQAAAATYQALGKDSRLSGTDGAQEAAFRLGVAHYMAGAYEPALDAWKALLATDPESDPRARALYWSGKALEQLGRQPDARQAFEQAAAQRPLSYFALRAHRALHPDGQAKPLDQVAANAETRARDEQELARWFKNRGLDLEQARALVLADPALQRAQQLAQLGLYREAGWEFEELLTRHQDYGDRLYVAADVFQRLGLYYGGTRLGMAALAASTGQETVLEVPRALARVAYPLAFANLVWPLAQQAGVDPLLFTALMRQESEFDQFAESVASARGLTQIIPTTAKDIATGLSIRNFNLDQLYLPSLNVRFGTSYFGDRLRRFLGNPYPALAAYNAGDGNVDTWLRPERVADQDIFAEYVPFDETFDYVRKIFAYWEVYRAVYGG